MYKIVDTISHEILLGSEKAVIKFAQESFKADREWIDDHHWELKRNGIDTEVRTFQGAVKFLQMKWFEIVDLGDIITPLNNDEWVSILTEEQEGL